MSDDTNDIDHPPEADERKGRGLHVKATRRPGERQGTASARHGLGAALDATLTLDAMHRKQQHPLGDRPGDVLDALEALTTGDETGEDRLLTQALVLDKLFNHMTRVALGAEYVSGMSEALKLAMRAQAQSRATYQAVSDIRNPRQYIGQQNVAEQYNAAGHQQVNRDAHADARQNPPTELSPKPEGQTDELHPNRGAPAGIEGAGAALEAVGGVDRAANG